jgi:hypothetical protein
VSFYVYLHRKATTGEVFYVGKGNKARARSTNGRNQRWRRTVAKHGLVVEIVEAGMQEWWAFELEAELIALYGRQNLANMTDGGDGPAGYRHREDSRARMSKAKTGRSLGPMREEHRRKISEAQAGKPRQKHGEEARQKISAALRLRERTEETRRRLSQALTGKRLDDAGRAVLVKAQGGGPVQCLETGEVFFGASPAARWLQSLGHARASAGAVSNACSGRAAHAYGYRFVRVTAASPPPSPPDTPDRGRR